MYHLSLITCFLAIDNFLHFDTSNLLFLLSLPRSNRLLLFFLSRFSMVGSDLEAFLAHLLKILLRCR